MQGSRTLTDLLGRCSLQALPVSTRVRTGCKTDGCAVCYKPTRFALLCASPAWSTPGPGLSLNGQRGLSAAAAATGPRRPGASLGGPLMWQIPTPCTTHGGAMSSWPRWPFSWPKWTRWPGLSDGSHCPIGPVWGPELRPHSPSTTSSGTESPVPRDASLEGEMEPATAGLTQGISVACRAASVQGPRGLLCCLLLLSRVLLIALVPIPGSWELLWSAFGILESFFRVYH